MKILWLCNTILPQISVHLGLQVSVLGGWLVGLSNSLLQIPELELTVCFPVSAAQGALTGELGNLHYYGFVQSRKNAFSCSLQTEEVLTQALKDSRPDVVHIFGTEYPHSLAMVHACSKIGIQDQIVINVQGLVSVCAKHYYCALPQSVIRSYTIRDLIRKENIEQSRKLFERKGVFEVEALRGVQHIIGRTDWDLACSQQINPNAMYHFCNETLRDEFYKRTWTLDGCERHSIFLSQCSYPIKGFHLMLEAMPEIIRRYPDAHIYTTGKNPLLVTGIDKLKLTSYAKYLGKLIQRYYLEQHVTFLGSLQEKEMCDRLVRSHVFVSASSIENSPNSVGEAMLVGVPVVSSDVGGVKNMLKHEEDGFIYPYDEPYMIAHYICRIFGDDTLSQTLSRNARAHAAHTHNTNKNLKVMLDIYRQIAGHSDM